jgi:hypothetical protein
MPDAGRIGNLGLSDAMARGEAGRSGLDHNHAKCWQRTHTNPKRKREMDKDLHRLPSLARRVGVTRT